MGCVGALFPHKSFSEHSVLLYFISPGLSGNLGMERVFGLSFLRIISFKSKNCLWWSSAVLAKSRSPLGKKRTARYLMFVNYICDITEREGERARRHWAGATFWLGDLWDHKIDLNSTIVCPGKLDSSGGNKSISDNYFCITNHSYT